MIYLVCPLNPLFFCIKIRIIKKENLLKNDEKTSAISINEQKYIFSREWEKTKEVIFFVLFYSIIRKEKEKEKDRDVNSAYLVSIDYSP